MAKEYSSFNHYLVLAAIEAKLCALPCRGKHLDSGRAFNDLMDMVRNERQAASLRAAQTQARLRERNNQLREKRQNDL